MFSEMAEASISVGQFRCPICLDQLLDPVTIPCGHSYCMRCITDYWNQLDHTAVYNCPLCKRTFTPRPSLYKNGMLAEMVENLKQTKVEAVHPAPSYAGAGDVECDVCAGRKYRAVKSCLICLESYCQTHFEQHEKFHSGRRHKMTDATGRLQEMICPKHDKLEIFCRTDQQCICYLCPMDEHKNHDTVATVVERTEKQRTLGERRREFQQSILERENTIQNLKKSVKTQRCSAQAAVENIERTFTELIRSIERSRSEVTQMIRGQENSVLRKTEEILKQLEQETVVLRKRDAELEQLLQMDNDIQFLQSFQSVASHESPGRFFITPGSLRLGSMEKNVSELKVHMEDLCRKEVDEMMTDMCNGLSTGPSYIGSDAIKNLEIAEEMGRQTRKDPFAGLLKGPLFVSPSSLSPPRFFFEDFDFDLNLDSPVIYLPSPKKDTETP